MQLFRQRVAGGPIRLIAAVMALVLVAAACGGSDGDDGDTASDDGSEAPTDAGDDEPAEPDTDEPAEDDGPIVTDIEDDPAESGPVAGGTLRFGLNAEGDGLNPTTSQGSAAVLAMLNAVFDTLAVYDAEGNFVPYLAESFTPNDDFTSWTVKLRDGITFHDGTPLDADAAIANFQAQASSFIVGIAVRPFIDPDNPIEKVDDLTYTVNLVDGSRYWPAWLTGQLGMVASPAWLAAAADDPELNQEPVGTGPFVFDSRQQDSVTRFVRNDDYWNGEVYLDAVEFHIYPDADSRSTAFFESNLEGLHSNDAATIADLLDDDSVQNIIESTGEEQFDVINTTAPPFDDIRARRALTLATPHENYVALLGLGVMERADQMFSPELPYHNPGIVQETDRPDEAVALAAEYCADFPENCTDNKINMNRSYSKSEGQTREAELLAEGWSVAFNVELEDFFEDDHINSVITGAHQVADWRQFGEVEPSLDNVWLLCRTAEGGLTLNFARLCDPERDDLLLQAQLEEDPAVRAELYQQVVERINQDYAYLFYVHTVWDIAYRDNVRGVCERTTPEGVEQRCTVNGRTFYDKLWLSE